MLQVVIVGAGAAGLGAATRLKAAGVEAVVLEAGSRVGGRAHTVAGPDGVALDLGCGWLHSAGENPLTGIAVERGFAVDRSAAAWTRPALDLNFPADDQRAYRQAFEAFEARLEAAAEGPDRPASSVFTPADSRWVPLLNAFSGYYNGAPFERISVKDYAAYQPTDDNWRVARGYGALIADLAHGLDVRLSTPVRLITHGPGGVRVSTSRGEIAADAVIVTVSTAVLARGAIGFDPPLPDHVDAAHALPLGHVEKAFLGLTAPDSFPVDGHVYGRTDTAETGSYTLRPLGAPVIKGFFGGDLAAGLESDAPGALTAFAIDELVGLFGSDFRRRLTPLAESRWRSDPYIGGAYSHARVGRADARAVLAGPVERRIWFAGEACSPHAFSTAHGAWGTGFASADGIITQILG